MALSLTTFGLVAGGSVVGQESPGQADLDRAVLLKVEAKSLRELGEVIRLCESALKKGLDPDNADFARKLLAGTRLQRGLQIAEELLPIVPPQHPELPKLRETAAEDLRKALEIDPQVARGWLALAKLELLPGGNPEAARKAVDQAVATAVEDPRVRAEALMARAAMEKDPQKKLADLTAAIEANPTSAMPYRMRGALYADLGEEEKCLADFNRALEIEPDHALTWQVKGMALAKFGRYDEALACFEKVRELAPEATAPLLEQARVLGLQMKFDEALNRLDQVLQRDPRNPAVLLLRAAILLELKRDDEALEDVNRVLEVQPRLALALRLRLMLLVRKENLVEAVKTIRTLRELEPEDRVLLAQHGLLEMAVGRPRKAIELFSQLLEKEPENATALIARGDCYLSVGKHAEAIADFEKALPLAQDNATFLNNFAWVLCTSPDDHLRDGKRALELAQKACELLEFKAAFALSTLAAAYAELGDFQKAIEWAEKAVAAAEGEEKEHIQKELESYRQGKPFRERQEKPEAPEEAAPSQPPKSPQPAAPPATEDKAT
jgi:tetratricopeptide (TPR) repeat protein